MKPFFISRWLCVACFSILALPVLAESEQDRARDAVRAGELMPLGQVLQQVEKNSPGKVLKVGLEQKGEIWVYKIKLLRDNGTLSKLYFDARDGTLLEKEPHHGRHGHRWGRRGSGGWENGEDD
ncbi:MAG: peptidase [Betaproteobacteria bacterium]|nr:peptidase [Betaproteobacteria bacterium]